MDHGTAACEADTLPTKLLPLVMYCVILKDEDGLAIKFVDMIRLLI